MIEKIRRIAQKLSCGFSFLFLRAMSQAAALARIFGECREGQIHAPLGRKEQARSCPVAC